VFVAFVLCLGYMLPVSLDCSFFISRSVFSNVYLLQDYKMSLVNSTHYA
jgi:hypothetical protein